MDSRHLVLPQGHYIEIETPSRAASVRTERGTPDEVLQVAQGYERQAEAFLERATFLRQVFERMRMTAEARTRN
jgi:hypothetical protein